MAVLQKLFLARYSFIAGAILFLLPVVVLQFGIAGPLLAGLFDLDGFWEMFWATFFAYLLSVSVFVTFRISSLYGPLRCGFADAKTGKRVMPLWVARALFLFVLLLPLPMIVNAYILVGSSRQLWGAVVGFVSALIVAFVIDLAQRLFNTFQGESDQAKLMLLPFSFRVSKWCEEADLRSWILPLPGVSYLARKLEPLFGRIQKFVTGLNPRYGLGIIDRSCEPASVYPGIVLGIAAFVAFLLIYIVGLFLWLRPFAGGSLLLGLGITTMTYFLVLITLVCWLLVGVAFYADRFRVPTIILLLVILIFSQADHRYVVRQSADPGVTASTPYSILNARKNDRYIILVAANGGGIQSAAWTAEVLTRVDEACRQVDSKVEPDNDGPGCRDAIALISGVSGGSVGTMYYVDGFGNTTDESAMNDVVRRSAASSSLAYVGGGLAFNDVLRNVPVVNWLLDNGMDRGKHLEQGWIKNRGGAECESLRAGGRACDALAGFVVPTHLSQTMSQWGSNITKEPRWPAVIFNATMVESGKRLLFSSAQFQQTKNDDADWMTFNQLFDNTTDVDVVEAVRLSASFPFVTPAAASPGGNGTQNDHVVDGGYFDNYGLMSVRDFIADAMSKADPFAGGNHPKVIIIQIYGDEVVKDANGKADSEASRQLNQNRFGFFSWYQQTFAPLNTMLNVRQTSQYTRNLEAYNQIVDMLDGKADVSHYVFKFSKKKNLNAPAQQTGDAADRAERAKTEVFAEEYEPPPLSWHLTKNEKAAIARVSCDMRSGDNLNENTTYWRLLMDVLRTPGSTTDWTRCTGI